MGSTDSFIGVAKLLSRDYRCILVDFAGFGKTKEPKVPYTLHDYTKDLNTLLDELNIKECFFIAHSFGGRVAIDYVTSIDNNVKGLILCDIAGLKPRRGIKYYFKIIHYKIKKKLHFNVDNMGSADYRVLSDVMKGTFVNIVNEYLNNRLHNIHMPTLLIWGDKDRETPLYMARKLNKGIKGSSLIIFEGRGHFAYLEESYRFYLIVKSFLEGIY